MFKSNDLLRDIKNKRERWGERSQFKIKGVGNLSQSDLDSLVLYAETYNNFGDMNHLICPLGSIKEVLEEYGYY